MKIRNKTVCENCPSKGTCKKNRAKISRCKIFKKRREQRS